MNIFNNFKIKNKSKFKLSSKSSAGFTSLEIKGPWGKFKKGKTLMGFNQLNNFVKDKINAKRYLAGFTVIEIILAVGILAFGIVLVYSAFSMTIVSTSNISLRFTAAYLVQEGLEIIRNLRDNNFINNITWSSGLAGSPCNTGCQADYKTKTTGGLVSYNNDFLRLDSDGFYSHEALATPTIFNRKITISPISETTDALKVTVLVTWSYNNKPFSFLAEEYLYNWD